MGEAVGGEEEGRGSKLFLVTVGMFLFQTGCL